jgi:hypothetical protein
MWPFDQNNQPAYQQYSQAYDTGNYNSVDPSQAFGHLQQFMSSAPDDMQQQLYMQHFSQMPYEQRALLAQRVPPQYGMDINNPASMSQSFWRLGREQPHLIPQILNHPLLLGAGLGLAGLVAKHVLEHQHRNAYEQQNQYNQGGYQQNQYNQGGYQQDQFLQQELAQEQLRDQQLQSEIRNEERQIERLEEREQRPHHHRRDEDYF